MSNVSTFVVNLGKDPEDLEVNGKELVKLRLAANSGHKKAVTRWFTALVGGPDVAVARRLRQSDTILITGELILTEYKPKSGPNKGKVQREDEMPFAKIVRVLKSPTFFAQPEEEPAEEPPELADLEIPL